jgi:hypothetical protein
MGHMKTIRLRVLPALLFGAACVAGCSSLTRIRTLGEVLDQGAVHQDKDQVLAMIEGKLLQTGSPDGRSWLDLHFNPNGDFTGTVRAYGTGPMSDRTSAADGTWRVEDSGRWCVDITMRDWAMKERRCFHVFRLGSELVLAGSATNREAKAGVKAQSDLK